LKAAIRSTKTKKKKWSNLMELIRRYLHEVGKYLSPKNRDDILKELSSVLTDAVEARSQGESTEEDVIEVLKEFGPPNKVAASYWPEGQYLIGPALFPHFRTAMGITLLVMAIVYLVLIGVLVVMAGQYQQALDLAGGFIGSAFTALGIVVLIFYLIQRYGLHTETGENEWDPRTLPEVEDHQEIKRGEVITDIVFSIALISFLVIFKDGFPFTTSLTAEWSSVTNPVLIQYFPLVIASFLIGIFIDFVLLWRGKWTVGMRLLKIAGNLLDILVVGILLAGHQAWLAPYVGDTLFDYLLLVPRTGTFTPETVQIMVMQAFFIALVVVLIVEIIETISQIYRLVRQVTGNEPLTIELEGTR